MFIVLWKKWIKNNYKFDKNLKLNIKMFEYLGDNIWKCFYNIGLWNILKIKVNSKLFD